MTPDPSRTSRLFYTTVVRRAAVAAGGEICSVEWPSGTRLAARVVVPDCPPVVDPNPRGNSRGGRGIAVFNGVIIVASYHSLEICDRETLRPLATISDGNFAGIHEVTRRGDQLFVASTATNAAAAIPLPAVENNLQFCNPRYWWPTEDAALMEQLGLPATYYHNKHEDNRLRHLDLHNRGKAGHLHLNAVDADNDGVYALFNKPGAIVRLNDMRVVLRHALLEGSHNLDFVEPGRAYVVSTRAGLLLDCDLRRGELRTLIDLNATSFAQEVLARASRTKSSSAAANNTARALFWRGLAMNDDWIFVGTSPAAILGFDRRTLAFGGVVRHSENVREIVHGIAIDET